MNERSEQLAFYDETSYTISLHISHPYLSESKITSGIGINPSSFRRNGAQKTAPDGTVISGTYARNFWSARDVEGGINSDKTIEVGIDRVLDILEKNAKFVSIMNSSGGETSLFVGFFIPRTGSIYFDKKLIDKAALLGVSIRIDVYAAEDNARPPPVTPQRAP